MAIFDTMNFLSCDVVTYCVGQAASMATILLAAGTKGKRYSLPNSRVMIHQPYGGATGQARDVSIAANEILRWRTKVNEILSNLTGNSVDKIAKDSDRDFFMTAEEAVKYGIVDKVIENKKDA
jgi:ATP-dependent Clp protease protease subunit